jgi:FkbM family methyltransferase
MIWVYARRTLDRLGLKGLARSTLMYFLDDQRTISIDGTRARFVHEDFSDYMELNRVETETEIIRHLRDELRPDDVFLDVGSNLGTYTVFVGDVLDTGRVIAVEAVPSTADTLRRNLELNDVDGTVANVAFGDEPGTVPMRVPDSHGSSAVSPGVGNIDVECVRGDDYLRRSSLPSPTIVKLDVEGYEFAVVQGLRESLRASDCRLVYCEVHPDRLRQFGTSTEEFEGLLENVGFDLDRIADLPGGRYIVRGAKSGGGGGR